MFYEEFDKNKEWILSIIVLCKKNPENAKFYAILPKC